MKQFISLLLLLAVFFLGACASTSSKSSGAGSGQDSVEKESSTGSRLLMDRYKSGEIPGYRD